MARGNLFLSQARGKVGSVVFSVRKGEQITRVYNPKPDNPRSYLQQAQRSLIPNMTKFYKRGTSYFFKFSFEDKTRYESDFNAFARNNTQAGCYLPRELFTNPNAPALGNYTLTKGSLGDNFNYYINGDNFIWEVPGLASGSNVTIGQLSSLLLSNYPAMRVGDIISIVTTTTTLTPDLKEVDEEPVWDNLQFIVNPDDITKISVIGLSIAKTGATSYGISIEKNFIGYAGFGAVVLSRNSVQGLRVSTTHIALNAAGAMMVDYLSGAWAKRNCAISWGGNPDAYLQGNDTSFIGNIIKTLEVDTHRVAPFSYVEFATGAPNNVNFVVTGVGLPTSTTDTSYTMDVYVADPFNNNPYPTKQLVQGKIITQGGQQSIQFTIDGIFRQQNYYVLKYKGEPISWGLAIYSAYEEASARETLGDDYDDYDDDGKVIEDVKEQFPNAMYKKHKGRSKS